MTQDKEVMKRVYNGERLLKAWQQVRRNAGAAGIDGITVKAFEKRPQDHLQLAERKLKAGDYRFKPNRRVLIPKPGTQKKRTLGIPVVLDRVVSQSCAQTLEEIFDKKFSSSNFGYRRGKNQHQAVQHMRKIIGGGAKWCISLDLKDFFNEIPHGLIFKLIRRQIADEQLVTLIARALKAGVVVDGKVEKTEKGTPQGSPLSPILSNIVLNEVDQELDKRGLRYVRWADDLKVFVKSRRAAERVMESLIRLIEGMGLKINRDKSQIEGSHTTVFCGFEIRSGKIRISNEAKKAFKREVRHRTKRDMGESLSQVVKELNKYVKGWINYFHIQEFDKPLMELDMFMRNRLRAVQLRLWKRPTKFQRMMIRLGRPVAEAKRTWVEMTKWQSVMRREVRYTLNNAWCRRTGLVCLSDYRERSLELRFTL